MRAVFLDEAITRLRLTRRRRHAKQDEIFPEQPDGFDRRFRRQFAGRAGDVPVAPQQFARGSTRADSRQRVVFGLRQHC